MRLFIFTKLKVSKWSWFELLFYQFQKKKKNEKNVDYHGSIKKKFEKKQELKNGLLKRTCFCQNKKTNKFYYFTILFESKKEECQCINVYKESIG